MNQKICLALCTYNGERFLQEQLDSIASQTRLPDLLVTVDDKSSDGTVKIIESFAKVAPFPVKNFVNDKNLGFIKNFEKAVRLCEGEIITLVDQDDFWVPEKLQIVEKYFSDDPLTDMVFSDAYVVDEKLNSLGYSLWESVGINRSKQELFENNQQFKAFLKEIFLTGATMAFRSKYRDKILPFTEDWSHDAWIYGIISVNGRIRPISEKLIFYRQHNSNTIGIGPPLKKNFLTQKTPSSRHQQARSFDKLYHNIYKTFRDEILSRKLLEPDDKKLLLLEEKIQHSLMLSNLPDNKFARVIPIIKSLLEGKYNRCSSGIRTALKDLLL
jgi:glycosyltransferase involved in cell wall biosynthesis